MAHDELNVDDDFDGQRLDRWLTKVRPGVPNALIQKLIRKGAIRVDGKRAKADMRLSAGQNVKLPILETVTKEDAVARAVDRFTLDVVYQDDTLLVINKPSGLAVQGGSGLRVHLEMLLDDYAVRGVAPRLVHRIDRETSGILVMARSASAARHLGDQFKGRDVEKRYLALVSPVPKTPTGTIDAPMQKIMVGTDLEKMAVAKGGDPAVTTYRVLSSGPVGEGVVPVALVEFAPKTGRTHQIRVHAAHIGCPLLGDAKYGGNVELMQKIKVKSRVMLHAAEITITHPKTGERMAFSAPLPPDFDKALAKLKIQAL